MDINSPLPHNLESERSVLGAILLEPGCIIQIADKLKPDHFYLERHRIIYRALLSVCEQDDFKPQTIVLQVEEKLKSADKLEECGGLLYLSELLDGTGCAVNIEYFSSNIIQHAHRRAIAEHALIMHAKAIKADSDPEDLAVESMNFLGNIGETEGKTDSQSIYVAVEERYDDMKKQETEDYDQGLMTGILELDELTHGLKGGKLFVVAGRPSMGKTASVFQMLRFMASHRKRVHKFSLEMDSCSLADRLITLESGLDMDVLSCPKKTKSQWSAINKAKRIIEGYREYFTVDDTPGLTHQEIMARAKRIHAKTPLECIAVDYLQLMGVAQGQRKNGTRNEDVSEQSKAMKNLARSLGIPVILLSQLKRYPPGRTKGRMSDLRDSGSIEQDADLIAIINTDISEDDIKNTPVLPIQFDLAKHRNGKTGTINLNFLKAAQRFESAATRREEANEPKGYE